MREQQQTKFSFKEKDPILEEVEDLRSRLLKIGKDR